MRCTEKEREFFYFLFMKVQITYEASLIYKILNLAERESLIKINYPTNLFLTNQMAQWDRASASGSVDLGFDFESGQTNDFKIGIDSFPARLSASKGQYGEQAGKFTCCATGKNT